VEGSTALTQRLGDATAMGLLRRHDDIGRTAVKTFQGSEVKHTGDGIMASGKAAGGRTATKPTGSLSGKMKPRRSLTPQPGCSQALRSVG
jgi:class 3 adenylate cyclase